MKALLQNLFSIKNLLIILFLLSLVVLLPASTKAASVKISDTKKTLAIGEDYCLKVKGAKGKIKWSSSKESVVSIEPFGRECDITAKKIGKATITAKIGKIKRKCKVTVKSVNDIVKISLPNMPYTVNSYGYNNEIQKSVNIIDAYYSGEVFKESNYRIRLCLSGTVLYNSSYSPFDTYKVSWRLYDGNNNVVESGETWALSYAVGETFWDKENMIFNMKPGKYTLKIVGVV